jgi:hypothetical protein
VKKVGGAKMLKFIWKVLQYLLKFIKPIFVRLLLGSTIGTILFRAFTKMDKKDQEMLKKINQRENLSFENEGIMAGKRSSLAFDTRNRKLVLFFELGDYIIYDFKDVLSWKVNWNESTQYVPGFDGYGITHEQKQRIHGERFEISVADTQRPVISISALSIKQANQWCAYLDSIINGNATAASPIKVKNIND